MDNTNVNATSEANANTPRKNLATLGQVKDALDKSHFSSIFLKTTNQSIFSIYDFQNHILMKLS